MNIFKKQVLLIILIFVITLNLFSNIKSRIIIVSVVDDKVKKEGGKLVNEVIKLVEETDGFDIIKDEKIIKMLKSIKDEYNKLNLEKEIAYDLDIDKIVKINIREKGEKLDVGISSIISTSRSSSTTYMNFDKDFKSWAPKYLLKYITEEYVSSPQTVPDMTLKDLNSGKKINLAKIKNKIILIGFYDIYSFYGFEFNVEGAGIMKKLKDKYQDNVEVVFGVDQANEESLKKFRETYEVNYYFVDAKELYKKWPLRYRSTVFIVKEGRIVDSFGGYHRTDYITQKIGKYLPEKILKKIEKETLVRAVKKNDIKTVTKFLKKENDLNKKEDGLSALHWAVKNKNYKMVKLLVEKNADLNIEDINYRTPLHIAALNGDSKIFKFLITSGADVYKIDYFGNSVYSLAVKYNNNEISKYLNTYLGEKIVLLKKQATYKEVLKSGIKPKIKPDFNFPVSKQHENGCFGFGVKHIVQYKYNKTIDIADCEIKINKPRNELWSNEHINDFSKLNNLTLHWNLNSINIFSSLAEGEPVLIMFKYYFKNGTWIGHFVAVYSFDEKGFWIAESIENKLKRIPYDKVFVGDGYETEFMYATVVMQN